jgi:ribosomal-protein-alanine N-acetyltransferase
MPPYGPPRLRSVLKSDLDAIAELEATAFGTNSLTRSALDVIYDPSGGFWLLAEDDEGVWGHSVNARGEDPQVGWVLGMAIHPLRQGRGWGRILLDATIERLQSSGIDVIRLLVHPGNRVAYGLYHRYGFVDTGERVDHFGPGQDRVTLSLLLRPDPHLRRNGMPVPQVPADLDQTWNS